MPPLMLDMASPQSPSHNPLSIRTAKKGRQSIQQAPSTTSSQQPYPEYPIKIPPEKQAKAVELYNTFILADLLAQNDTVTHNDGYLLPTGQPTARSVTSQASSKHRGAPSTSASTFDAMTDYGSVVSFNQSPTSATELTSFDGKKVRTRKRKRLTPKARAKAALVRYLGSCQPCRSRRVPCPLDHHDIQFLELLRHSMPNEETRPEPQPSPLSAASSSSQKTARSVTKQEPASSNAISDDFLGIGAQLPELPEMDFDTQLDMDILSSGQGGSYDNTQAERPPPATLDFLAPDLPIVNPNPYATFLHGALFSLGCQRDGLFLCQHLQICPQRFNTADELQHHFASAHFEFTRIDPAHRYICSICNQTSLFPTDACSCPTPDPDTIELWICGHFIRRPWFQRDNSDGSDFQGYQPGSNYYDSPSLGGANAGGPWNPSTNNRGSFGGGLNQGPFSHQGGYGRTANRSFGWDNSNGSGSGSNQYRGNFLGTRQRVFDGNYSFQIWYSKAQRKSWHMKPLVLVLLLSTVLFAFSHEWIITKAQLAIPGATASIRPHLPVVGFVILMASIVVPLATVHLTARRTRCVSTTIVLDRLVKKHADDKQRDLDVLCKLLHSLLSHLHADQLDLNILCVVSCAYDTKRADDLMIMPSTEHELQRPP